MRFVLAYTSLRLGQRLSNRSKLGIQLNISAALTSVGRFVGEISAHFNFFLLLIFCSQLNYDHLNPQGSRDVQIVKLNSQSGKICKVSLLQHGLARQCGKEAAGRRAAAHAELAAQILHSRQRRHLAHALHDAHFHAANSKQSSLLDLRLGHLECCAFQLARWLRVFRLCMLRVRPHFLAPQMVFSTIFASSSSYGSELSSVSWPPSSSISARSCFRFCSSRFFPEGSQFFLFESIFCVFRLVEQPAISTLIGASLSVYLLSRGAKFLRLMSAPTAALKDSAAYDAKKTLFGSSIERAAP